MSFAEVGIEIEFKGEGVNEKGYVAACSNEEFQLPVGKEVVVVDSAYFRPTEVDLLIGNPEKAKTKLGWEPTYDLAALVKEMVAADVIEFKKSGKTQLEHLIG